MTFATSPPQQGSLTTAALASALDAQPPVVAGRLRRAAMVIGDLLGAVGIVLFIPFVIIAIGIPIALCARLLLWIAAML